MIDAALDRGHTVELWHDYSEGPKSQAKSGQKGYLFPYTHSSPFYSSTKPNLSIEAVTHRDTFRDHILHHQEIDFFLALSPMSDAFFDIDDQILRHIDGKWVMIAHGGDSILELTLENSYLAAKYRRVLLFDTKHNLQAGIRDIQAKWPRGVEFLESPLTEIHFVGSSMMQSRFKFLDKQELRSKYKIPNGLSPVVYLPFPFLANRKYRNFPVKGIFGTGWALQSAWSGVFLPGRKTLGPDSEARLQNMGLLTPTWKLICLLKIFSNPTALTWFARGLSEPSLVRHLQAFCGRQNLFLIVKPRRKFPYPPILESLADLVIDDDEQQVYPTKLQELLQISELVVGGLSSAVLEAVFAGVPYINIGFPPYDLPTDEDWVYDYTSGSMYNYPGVVTNISVAKLHQFSWTNSLLHVDALARNAYLDKFVGPLGQNSSDNVLNVLRKKSDSVARKYKSAISATNN